MAPRWALQAPPTHSRRRSNAPTAAGAGAAALAPPRQAGAGEASSASSSEGKDKPSSTLPPPPPPPEVDREAPEEAPSLKLALPLLGALPGLATLPLPLLTLEKISRNCSSPMLWARTPRRASAARAAFISMPPYAVA